MRPYRSFLFLLIFLVCFTGLYYILPHSFRLPSPADLVPEAFDGNLLRNKLADSVMPAGVGTEALFRIIPDTIIHSDTIAYIDGQGSVIPLRGFVDSLYFSKDQLRVMYYGDSQIEGDRVSSYLRHWLRQGREGTGPGLFLPLMPVMYTESVHIRSSSNWKRYNYLSFEAGELSHRNLGPFMTICRYIDEGVTAESEVRASVRIVPSRLADSTARFFDILRIFYGNVNGEVIVNVSADDYHVLTDTLEKGAGPMEVSCRLYGTENILIEFEGKVSPDIYGLSIESRKGIIVDNIPQRGSAGLEFTMVDREHMKRIFNLLSPDLFVLHYGLNIVKNVRSEYSYYRLGLSRQIDLLRELCPEAHILVVGVTDMATGTGDSIRSYQNIPAIIRAQKSAAQESGATFWNSYEAMGGPFSIVRWADKNPPLAQKDYVHFTNPGADSLSKMLVSEMFRERDIDTLITADTLIVSDTIPVPVTYYDTTAGIEENEKGFFGTLISIIFYYDPDRPFIFSSPAFWIFFLFILAGYSIIYKKLLVRNLYLFLISLFFYYKSGGLFLILLILVTIVDYSCGLLISRSQTRHLKRLWLLLSIVSNIGLLAYFKYTGFFAGALNDLFGTSFEVHDFLAAFSNNHLGTSFNVSTIILPVGISFFTFQSLSYTIDVYRNKLTPVRNMLDFGFYVSFFPQLVAGPIVRASEFIPQLYARFQLTKREFSHALFLILKGLIKKIIISDFIAVNFIDRVFEFPAMYSGFENLTAIYGYGLQIYCDFSGYTDIAIGLALILGFRLPVNFNSPYKASDVSDFWKRWHISLSRWLKDYLYIPLGGNRKGKLRTHLNLMVTMLLGGLWHGAALKFLIWGGLHGTGLVINKIWYSLVGHSSGNGRYRKAIAVFITFNFVSFCWIFFRAPDLQSVGIMVKQITGSFSPGSWLTVLPSYSTVFILIITGYLIHFLPEKVKESYRGLFIRVPLAAQMLVAILVAVLMYQMRSSEVMPFIYFRF